MLVNFLAAGTFAYGLSLLVTLPWSMKEAAFAEGGLAATGPFGHINAVLLVAIGTFILLRWLIIQGLAFVEFNRIRRSTSVEPNRLPFVSILVPAFNESETVVAALQSLIHLDYPAYEVIFIDDGSLDDTYAKARPIAGKYGHCTVQVFTKPNGGKWSALNFAYEKARGDLILFVDADSGLARDALKVMVPRLLSPGVAAVSGQVTIRNRNNMLTRFQSIEYLLGNGGMRTALSALGLVTVVPGPIGLYRREILEEIRNLPGNKPKDETSKKPGDAFGPLSGETFAEDFQLSLSALALGGRIVYEPRAYAYTRCPEEVGVLMNQRYRWFRGTWQVYAIYWRQLRHLKKEKIRYLPTIMALFYPLDIYLVPILNFVFWGSIALSAAAGVSLDDVVIWIGSVSLLNVMTATIYVLEQDDEIELLPFVPLLDIYQSLLVNSAWIVAAIDEVRGTRMKWS
ncbi:glycosyltransferase [Microvirga arabica]|uniref:Glycosyltransferase n=1 Tax=Microvirga arabica TaxID=1128671 RepID=A0ABV6YDR2_9HYPH